MGDHLGDLWPNEIICHPHGANTPRETLPCWVLKGCHPSPPSLPPQPWPLPRTPGPPHNPETKRKVPACSLSRHPILPSLQYHACLHPGSETFIFPTTHSHLSPHARTPLSCRFHVFYHALSPTPCPQRDPDRPPI